MSLNPGSSKITVIYSNAVSSSIELRNPAGFEVCSIFVDCTNFIKKYFLQMCCQGKEACSSNDTLWVPAVARAVEGERLTISLTGPDSCASNPINGVRYLWRETPCLFKEAAVYSGEDSDLPAPPYIHYF